MYIYNSVFLYYLLLKYRKRGKFCTMVLFNSRVILFQRGKLYARAISFLKAKHRSKKALSVIFLSQHCYPYNPYISSRPFNSLKYFKGLTCVDVHIASPCNSVAMKLSSFAHFFQARIIITSRKQVNALFTKSICT